MPIRRTPRWAEPADERPDGRAVDTHRAAQHQRAGGETRVRRELGQPVGPPAPLGDEHLAEDHRCRDGDLARADDPDQVHVQVALASLEPGDGDRGDLRREDEQDGDGGRDGRRGPP